MIEEQEPDGYGIEIRKVTYLAHDEARDQYR